MTKVMNQLNCIKSIITEVMYLYIYIYISFINNGYYMELEQLNLYNLV